MSFFFPQAVVTLRVRWETFGTNDALISKTSELTAVAKRLTVNINDYTEADTFDCELDYRNFPFDPRCIRALGITVHMEDRKAVFKKSGALDLLVPKENTYDSEGKVLSGNTKFVGFADEESIDFDESNRVVRFEGRDYTALLIDAPYTGKALDLNRPLDTIISGLLQELESTRDIQVINRTGGSLPNIGSYSPDFNALSGQKNGVKNENYWDVIKNIVSRAGLICYIELDKLIISKPRVLYGDKNIYQFIYGNNLKKLGFKRKLGRQKGINVLVRSVNLANKAEPVLTVKIPEEANASWCTEIGVAREPQKIEKLGKDGKPVEETAPYLSFNVPDIVNKDALIEKGQGIWEELGRQQIEGSLSTKDMMQIQIEQDKKESTYDLTKIRNGTAIKIEIEQGDLKGLMREKTEGARVRFLLSRGYENDVARAFAKIFKIYCSCWHSLVPCLVF